MPIVNGLEAEFREEIAVIRLDAANPDNEAIMRRLGLRGHPALAVLDEEGRLVARFFGAQSAHVLREELRSLIEP